MKRVAAVHYRAGIFDGLKPDIGARGTGLRTLLDSGSEMARHSGKAVLLFLGHDQHRVRRVFFRIRISTSAAYANQALQRCALTGTPPPNSLT